MTQRCHPIPRDVAQTILGTAARSLCDRPGQDAAEREAKRCCHYRDSHTSYQEPRCSALRLIGYQGRDPTQTKMNHSPPHPGR